MLSLTHLLWVGEVGRVPVATSMSVSVCIDMQVAISRMVMMVGGPVLCWLGSLSHGYVNRWILLYRTVS